MGWLALGRAFDQIKGAVSERVFETVFINYPLKLQMGARVVVLSIMNRLKLCLPDFK